MTYRREYPEDNLCVIGRCNLPALPQLTAPLCASHAKKAFVEIGTHFGLNIIQKDDLCNDPRHTAQRSRFAPGSKYSPKGTVYIVQMGSRIKIGFTRNLAQRVKDLHAEKILAAFPGTTNDERALHERFAEFRTIGEWFVADASLIAYAKDHDTRSSTEVA